MGFSGFFHDFPCVQELSEVFHERALNGAGLDLANPADFEVGQRLVTLDRWESWNKGFFGWSKQWAPGQVVLLGRLLYAGAHGKNGEGKENGCDVCYIIFRGFSVFGQKYLIRYLHGAVIDGHRRWWHHWMKMLRIALPLRSPTTVPSQTEISTSRSVFQVIYLSQKVERGIPIAYRPLGSDFFFDASRAFQGKSPSHRAQTPGCRTEER